MISEDCVQQLLEEEEEEEEAEDEHGQCEEADGTVAGRQPRAGGSFLFRKLTAAAQAVGKAAATAGEAIQRTAASAQVRCLPPRAKLDSRRPVWPAHGHLPMRRNPLCTRHSAACGAPAVAGPSSRCGHSFCSAGAPHAALVARAPTSSPLLITATCASSDGGTRDA